MKKGFTLIELLIVMGVIAILLGIIIPSFRGMQDEAQRARAQKECETLQVALEGYYKNTGSYPGSGSINLTYLFNMRPPLLVRMPADPFRTGPLIGTIYYYTYATGDDTNYGIWYMIGSKGPDRSWGTGTTYGGGTWFEAGDDIVVTNAPINRQ